MTALLPTITPGMIDPTYLQECVGKSALVILDIGANDGTHTLEFLKLFPSARIYAFEPDPRAFAKLQVNVTDPRVTKFKMAIGAKDGETQFHVSSGLPPNFAPSEKYLYPEGWDRSGSIRAPKTHKNVWSWCKFEKTIEVQVRRLDTWVRENGVRQIDLIWADTQGAEGDVIAGGAETLAATKIFYTEYSDDEWYEGQLDLKKIADMLPNFDIVRRYSMDALFMNRDI